MLSHFPFSGGASHAQIFHGAAETGQFMPLEMGHGNQGIGLNNLFSYIDFFEPLAIDGDSDLTFPPQSVRNHDGCLYDRVGEAVLNGGFQMAG